MAEKLQVLCGFENEKFEEALVKELKRAGKEPVIHVRYSKASIKEFLEKTPDCSTVVLTERIEKEKYTAEELAQLTDKRDVNVVVIISPRLQGTEFVKTLYTANITGAIFQTGRNGVGPKDVAEQIVNRRSRKDARVYYGIEGQKLDMGTLDEDTYVEYYNRLTKGDFILKSYIDLCVTMTPQQIADFTKRLPKEELSELGKYEEFYLIVDLLRKFGIDLKIKRPKKVMIGFKVKPQLGMSEGGLTFESVKEPEEVKEPEAEESKEEEVPKKEDVSDFSVDINTSSDNMDDLFAMLDGVTPAAGTKKNASVPKEVEIAIEVPVPNETKPVKEVVEMPRKEPENTEAERHLQKLLEERDRQLAEQSRQLSEKDRQISEKEKQLAEKDQELSHEKEKADAGAKAVDKYKKRLDLKEKEHEENLRRALEDNVRSEAELSIQHAKEMEKLLRKQNAMEKEMVKRGIYEDDEDGEDVYLTAGGPQFSLGLIALIILVVVVVIALIFFKPMFLTMGM